MKVFAALVLSLFAHSALARAVESDELVFKAVREALLKSSLICTSNESTIAVADLGFTRLFPSPKIVSNPQSQIVVKSLYGDFKDFEAIAEISMDQSEKNVTAMTISMYDLGANLGTILRPKYDRTLVRKLECR
jgi:hypothetical protein